MTQLIRCTSSSEMRPLVLRLTGPGNGGLVVAVDADGDQQQKDRRDDPVDDQAERRPPASVGHIVAPVLPQVLEPMTSQAGHQQPRRSGLSASRPWDTQWRSDGPTSE